MTVNFSEDIKKIFLAGLGAVAVTTEKSKNMIEELVKKGELTLEQGKVLNEELKHNVEQKVKQHITVTVNKPADLESVKDAVEKMSPQELAAVKAKIAEMEMTGAAEDAGE